MLPHARCLAELHLSLPCSLINVGPATHELVAIDGIVRYKLKDGSWKLIGVGLAYRKLSRSITPALVQVGHACCTGCRW